MPLYQFPPRNWWCAAVYRSNFVSGWLRFGRNSQPWVVGALGVTPRWWDDSEVTTSNSISLADVNKGLQLFTKVQWCNLKHVVWIYLCGDVLVLNRGVRVYCLNYVFWMFCNAGESYVCTIHAKPEYDEYMQHKHMSILWLYVYLFVFMCLYIYIASTHVVFKPSLCPYAVKIIKGYICIHMYK